MMGMPIAFQEYDVGLAEKLNRVLANGSDDNCYVGLNRSFFYPKEITEEKDYLESTYFADFMHLKCRRYFIEHCNKQAIYIDAGLGLNYVSKKSLEECQRVFSVLRELFGGKKLAIFAGESVFDGIQYDIFENAAYKQIIACPAQNAYRVYDQIIAKALSYPEDYILCFILGPTATVAAYELSRQGRVAWDIGHIFKDYDAFMKRLPHDSPYMKAFFE